MNGESFRESNFSRTRILYFFHSPRIGDRASIERVTRGKCISCEMSRLFFPGARARRATAGVKTARGGFPVNALTRHARQALRF